ncbi:MAG: glycosyltransferase family 39 protein [Candidatus Aquicultor sp.]
MGTPVLVTRAVTALKERSVQIVLAISCLGLFLRLYQLGAKSIWQDEGYSITLAGLDLPHMIKALSLGDLNPPLYFITLHSWIGQFGNSEFSARLLSASFSFFAIIVIYKLGTLLFNKEVGILGALLLAISPFNIHYAQEARPYSLLVLLALLSVYFFIKLLNRTGGISLGYILSSALLLYAHMFGSLVIVVENIFLLTTLLPHMRKLRSLQIKNWVFNQLLLIALFVPWIFFLLYKLLPQIHMRQGKNWPIPLPTAQSILDTFVSFSGEPFVLVIFAGMIAILLAGIIDSGKNRKAAEDNDDRYKVFLLLIWLFVPVAVAFTVSRFSVPVFADKYLIEVSPALYLLAARALLAIDYTSVRVALVGIVAVLSLQNAVDYYHQPVAEQWREVARIVDTKAGPGDLALFNIDMCQVYCFDYYSRRTDYEKKNFSENEVAVSKKTIDELEYSIKGRKRVWFVLFGIVDNAEHINNTLRDSFNRSYYKRCNGLEVCLFEAK